MKKTSNLQIPERTLGFAKRRGSKRREILMNGNRIMRVNETYMFDKFFGLKIV